MDNLQAYKDQLNQLQKMIDQLEKGELNTEDLSRLEELTRAIHERSVILKYKAYEAKLNPINESLEEDVIAEEEVVQEEISVEEEEIDFSIFDAPEEIEVEPEEEQIEEPMNQEPESIVEEPHIEEESIPQEQDVEEIEPQVATQSGSFLDQLNLSDNSLSEQFAGSKIDTLIGAFGLNQKLRFINELFDGSSESFGDAIKILDKQNGINEAQLKAQELASEHDWDPEEESVVEFMTILSRRYA